MKLTPCRGCGALVVRRVHKTPGAEERRLRARIAEAWHDGDRDEHDFHVEALTALSLAQAWRDEQTRPPRAPRRPGEGEVPAARFGPTDRRTGSERK